ncbi:MAG TPA: hypothetical protein VMQ59_01715, partial [Acidimicrobiales bacterium]|nr:hypothetical protein [Acidimicrobiales bacterium]
MGPVCPTPGRLLNRVGRRVWQRWPRARPPDGPGDPEGTTMTTLPAPRRNFSPWYQVVSRLMTT